MLHFNEVYIIQCTVTCILVLFLANFCEYTYKHGERLQSVEGSLSSFFLGKVSGDCVVYFEIQFSVRKKLM
jgi:hypothetical protein